MLPFKGKYDFLLILLSLSLISLTLGFGLFIQQEDYAELLFFYGFFFVVYVVIYRYVERDRTVYFFLGLALLLRLILVFVMPNLSDDVHRFVWDGRLIINGISPFLELPTYYIENNISLIGIDANLYDQLNSPNYFTVYPPVPQGVFALASWAFPKSIFGAVVAMKLVLLLCEMGTFILLIKLLRHYSLAQKNSLLYALNPLVIWDTFGNVHFEIVMVFFVLLSLWLLVRSKWHYSAFAMSFAVLSKLIPLMLLPFLIPKLGWKKAVIYCLIVGLMVVLCFFPFFDINTIKNLTQSLDLYFQKFEYNASVYYVLRYIGLKISGYNLIQILGPGLALLTAVSIFVMAFYKKNRNRLAPQWLFVMMIFLLLATTVHPWYLTLLIALCTLTRFRFPILWSGLIVMTYMAYSYAVFAENLWIVVLEYSLLGLFIAWELGGRKLKLKSTKEY